MNYDYNKLPIYYQLSKTIEKNIEDGVWKKGEAIPSERVLSEQYNVSRITVRSAINELVLQGKLEKVQGKGTFVIGRSIVQNLGSLYSFTREMEKQGKISSTKLVHMDIITADSKIAKNLGIGPHEKIIYVERLRCADEQPIMLERTYFKHDDYQFILDIDLKTKSLYQTLENEHGIYINKAIETFKACELTIDEAEKLHCLPRQYGLLVKRTSFTGEKVVCYSTIVSKGDIFEFTIKLSL